MSAIPDSYQKVFTGVLHEHPNYAPKGWREITEAEFATSIFFVYSPIAVDRHYFTFDYEGNKLSDPINLRVYYMYDGTGFGIHSNYWKKKLRFFTFGCKHAFREYFKTEADKNNWPYYDQRCHHNVVCDKCGFLGAHDSSD